MPLKKSWINFVPRSALPRQVNWSPSFGLRRGLELLVAPSVVVADSSRENYLEDLIQLKRANETLEANRRRLAMAQQALDIVRRQSIL